MEEIVTVKQCRDLRMIVDTFTEEPCLTIEEFTAIKLIFQAAGERIKQEGKTTQHD